MGLLILRGETMHLKAHFLLIPIIFLVIASMFSTSQNVEAMASNIVTVSGSTHMVSTDEVECNRELTNEIAEMARVTLYTTYNIYGTQTTKEKLLNMAENLFVIFYIGHGNWEFVLSNDHSYIFDDVGEKIYDFEVYYNSAYYFDKYSERITFLWSCFQGGGFKDEPIIIGDYYPDGTPYGMPLAWLCTTALSEDGYNDPWGSGRVFIGFSKYAPYLTYNGSLIGGLANPGYKERPLYWFTKMFFHYIFDRWEYLDPTGVSINEALDAASMIVWGIPFEQSPLYRGYVILDEDGSLVGEGKMVVYGDGSYILPHQRVEQQGPIVPTLLVINNFKEEGSGMVM